MKTVAKHLPASVVESSFMSALLKRVRTLTYPAKIVVPSFSAHGYWHFLGLGDIVLPGMLASLCLRFDTDVAAGGLPCASTGATGLHHRVRGRNVYLHTCLLGYVGGMVAANWAVYTFEVAQPALLYLCPATLVSVVLAARWRGDLRAFWRYDG